MKKILLALFSILIATSAQAVDPANTLLIQLKDGTVEIELLPEKAPKTVVRIKELAGKGFYNGIVFHRVIEGFMAQTGDPTGTGTGGSGQHLKAEFNDIPHVRGVVSMARASEPDSADSQFFIVTKDSRFLDGQYTAFGRVTKGMEFVDKIAKGEPPAKADKMISVKLASEAKK